AAARTLREAAWSAPFQIGGSGRFDTEAMQLGAGRVFVKMGAEGVHVGAIPELGYGVAIKIDDGATRAAEAVMAAVLIRLLAPEGDFGEWLAGRARRPMRNWAGVEVGEVRATELLAG
ncbi:asparaginase, partial [Hansschlegelia beijingensis]|uniref:asparaginase n=1 Tax=Hansschlegelia beijingensis TaxID=1133344 RepID=UPI00387F1D18